MKLKNIIGVGLLVFQVIMIVYARFVPARYYCWAPRDSINEYKLDVFLNGQNLNPEDIKKRYRIGQKGMDARSIQHVKDIVSQYEGTYGQHDQARILMTYTTNGGDPQQWEFLNP